MKIMSKKFIYGLIAGLIIAWVTSGLFCGSDNKEFEYMPGPNNSIYKIDKATGDVFWIVGESITKIEQADRER
jgi:hypothetical protein